MDCGILYLNTLFFAVAAPLIPQRKLIYAFMPLLGLFALFGFIEIFGHLVRPNPVRVNSGNAYLVYHDFRPAFVVVLPVFWMAMLVSPSMRAWIRGTASDEEFGPYQVSLADLMYLVLIACIALASSLALAALMHRAAARVAEPAAAASNQLPASGSPRYQAPRP